MFGVSPKITLNGLVTDSPLCRLTMYEYAPAGAVDCAGLACVSWVEGEAGCGVAEGAGGAERVAAARPSADV